jgi:hypothetical protein
MSWPGIEPGPFMVGGENSRIEPLEQLLNSYSEHLHMRARPVENAHDSTLYFSVL